ncbi:NB-ARC domain-containing protein [Corchorus olitorius]|uniref:NB-ARC domain-containing protein n=1 Tax=Corchorus olitorius TaxID=93759 RepID=A0A1R3I1R1_9ROSI|nr:NB-ARC domain-containing protein [Corchorus olitorius]
MAEAIVSLVVERLLDFLAHEAVSLQGVDDEVRSLVAELEQMKSALKDADRRQEQNELSCTVEKQIRELAYDAEDVIDTYIFKVPIKIDSCKGESSNSNSTQRLIRRTNSLATEVFVVSSKGITRQVLAQLMKEEDSLRVVSIVGMGGIGKNGSKILFTTRIKDVPLLADPSSSPIELPFLTDGASWELFKSKAFQADGAESYHACPGEFEKLGKDMVGKCGGLPLAIVVLGGLLATKRSLAQWEMVQRKFNADLNKRLGDLKKKLIRLWIAEGFISTPPPENGELLMEDEAEQCLEELINRCLVQVDRKDRTESGFKTCRIHDLLRDLCVKKAQEENFWGIIQPPSNVNNNDPHFRVNLAESQERRTAIHPSKRRVYLEGKHPKLRSLLLFQDEYYYIQLRISKCSNFRLLRVLNLVKKYGIKKWRVSSGIGNLHHLRYLGVEYYGDITMPGSFCKLKSLHSLRITCRRLIMTPKVLFKLERLRHFAAGDQEYSFLSEALYGVSQGVNINLPQRDTLKNIETLKYIKVGKNLMRNIDAMLGLINVQSLGLIFQRSTYVEPIVKSLIKLQRLRSLHMDFISIDGDELQRLRSLHMDLDFISGVAIPNLEPLSDCRRLTKLFLRGRIQAPHSSHPILKFLPENITKLTLLSSKMSVDPMGELGKLQHLTILQLRFYSYVGTKLVCSANGFPQLDYLEMEPLRYLEEWQIEEGSMPRLRSLN